jgi:hypothetical protein
MIARVGGGDVGWLHGVLPQCGLVCVHCAAVDVPILARTTVFLRKVSKRETQAPHGPSTIYLLPHALFECC